MEAKIYLPNFVYCTLKRHRADTVKNLFVSAALGGYKIMPFEDGFIATYEFAKKSIKMLRLHCSRFFTENDLVDMARNNLISQEEFNTLTA